MSNKLQKFRNSENPKSSTFIKKLNSMIDEINRANNISINVKNGTSSIKSSPKGHSININSLGGKAAAGISSSSFSWAKVITSLQYADPLDEVLPSGVASYTLRLVANIGYTEWEDETTYEKDDYLTYLEKLYRVRVDHVSDESSSKIPNEQITNAWYELEEEIKIDSAIGFQEEDIDIRNCVPWFQTDEIIPVVSREINSTTGETKWFIFLDLNYTGEPKDASIRWNDDSKRTMAVFK